MPEADPQTIQVAEEAFQAFAYGMAEGNWSSFLAKLTDDFSFWFPAGPFKGWNQGRERAQDFFAMVSALFPDGMTLTVQQVLSNSTTVIFEVRSQSTVKGQPYENQAAIAFDIRGDKVSAYREYLGVIFQFGQ